MVKGQFVISDQTILEIYQYYINNNKGLRQVEKVYNVSKKTLTTRFKLLALPIPKKTTRKHFFNENYFNIIDSNIKAYWLGFIFADGSITTNTNRNSYIHFELGLKLSDKDHIIKFAKELGLKEENIKTDSYRCRLILTSKLFCENLIKYGCTPRKSLTLEYPKGLIPKEFEYDFIRGYFDGDGCITNPLFHNITLSCLGTMSFLTDLLETLKIEKKIVLSKPNTKCFQFNLSGENAISFLKKIYNNIDIVLERKYYRYIVYVALRSRNITKAQGKFDEVLQKYNLDNIERVALEYLLKKQSL